MHLFGQTQSNSCTSTLKWPYTHITDLGVTTKDAQYAA
jgi:hypothetical protein